MDTLEYLLKLHPASTRRFSLGMYIAKSTCKHMEKVKSKIRTRQRLTCKNCEFADEIACLYPAHLPELRFGENDCSGWEIADRLFQHL